MLGATGRSTRRAHRRASRQEGWRKGVGAARVKGGATLEDATVRGERRGLSHGRAEHAAVLERSRRLQGKVDARDGTSRAGGAAASGAFLGVTGSSAFSQSLRMTSTQAGRGSSTLRVHPTTGTFQAPPSEATRTHMRTTSTRHPLGSSAVFAAETLQETGMARTLEWDAYGPTTALAGTAKPKRLDARAADTLLRPSDPQVIEERMATKRFLAQPLIPGVTGRIERELPTSEWGKTQKVLRAGVSDETVKARRPASDSFRAPYWTFAMRDRPELPAEVKPEVRAATKHLRHPWEGAGGKWVDPSSEHAHRPLGSALATPSAPFLPHMDMRARQVAHARPQTLSRDKWGMHRAVRGRVPPTVKRAKRSPSDDERLLKRAAAYSAISPAAKHAILQAKLARQLAQDDKVRGFHGGTRRSRLPQPPPMLAPSGRTLPASHPKAPRNRMPLQSSYYEPTATRGLVLPGARTIYTT